MYISRSGSTCEVLAPAKINLFLEVLGRRPDGFHEIETLMCAVNVFDKLRFVTRSSGPIQLNCRRSYGSNAVEQGASFQTNDENSLWGHLPENNDNIVLRILERFRIETQATQGASIDLIKRIPSEAGLGGASSDAAAALIAANQCWNTGWAQEKLADFAAEFGSDIPFFFTAGTAICRGRGERLEPVVCLQELDVVIVRPPDGLSTPLVYKNCTLPDSPANVNHFLTAMTKGNRYRAAQAMVNRLQSAAESLSPWIQKLSNCFERLNCLGHQMSGSGTSYFGICQSARHARCVAGHLQNAGLGIVMKAKTIRT